MLSYEDIIKLKCTEINSLPEEEIYKIVDVVIDHYYQTGFPYYQINEEKIKKETEYLFSFDVSVLELPENHLQQNMNGLNTVNAFHPEMWDVQCGNSKNTPKQIFENRELFKIALRKRIKLSDTKLVDFNIRKSLKAFGTQGASNFRPTIAKWVYEKFSPHGGRTLDPCAGYGGRLFGAFCSHIGEYVGNDPNIVSQVSNHTLYSMLNDAHPRKDFICKLLAVPFEEYKRDGEYDLVFTSPPYFNIEKYSLDNTQSWIRYKKYEDWVTGFLYPLVSKSFYSIKENGYLVLNVGKPIIDDTLRIGKDIFGSEPIIYQMRLSQFLGKGNKSKVSHKVEPILVWKK